MLFRARRTLDRFLAIPMHSTVIIRPSLLKRTTSAHLGSLPLPLNKSLRTPPKPLTQPLPNSLQHHMIDRRIWVRLVQHDSTLLIPLILERDGRAAAMRSRHARVHHRIQQIHPLRASLWSFDRREHLIEEVDGLGLHADGVTIVGRLCGTWWADVHRFEGVRETLSICAPGLTLALVSVAFAISLPVRFLVGAEPVLKALAATFVVVWL